MYVLIFIKCIRRSSHHRATLGGRKWRQVIYGTLKWVTPSLINRGCWLAQGESQENGRLKVKGQREGILFCALLSSPFVWQVYWYSDGNPRQWKAIRVNLHKTLPLFECVCVWMCEVVAKALSKVPLSMEILTLWGCSSMHNAEGEMLHEHQVAGKSGPALPKLFGCKMKQAAKIRWLRYKFLSFLFQKILNSEQN